MKLLVEVLIFIFFLMGFLSCDNESTIVGNGSYIRKEISLTEFENVSNPFSGTVKLKMGNPEVIVNAESNIIDLITFNIEDKSLRVGSKDVQFESGGIDLQFYSQNYNRLENNGSANWTSDYLEINPKIVSNGSGSFKLTGLSDTQQIISNGSGEINLLSMPTEDTNIESSSSGKILVEAINNAAVLIEGSGDVTVENISGILTVTINGSGNLYYSGNPSQIIQTINGSGKIIKLP